MWIIANGHTANATVAQAGEAHQLIRAHLQWHLERKVNALSVMDQELK